MQKTLPRDDVARAGSAARRLAPLALLWAGFAHAQTSGAVIGVVTDAATGVPVPGAAIVATSPSLQGEQIAVTDATGSFQFNLLPPGPYRLLVPALTAAGPDGRPVEYKEAERADVVVRVGATLRANLALVPALVRMEEQVVKGDLAPVIDVGTAETGTVVTKEFLAGVPLGRDYASAAIVAPGVQADLYGPSFGGTTSPENKYVIDGLNVTDPGFGTQGTKLLTNFVDEVNVKSGAFMPEFGGATGGVVNVVTKSGSNEFHGSFFGNVTPGFLSPSAKAIGLDAEAIATRPVPSKEYQADFGFELGGPIVKDRLWFHVGFAPVINHFVDERYYQALTPDPSRPGQALRDPSTGLAVGTRLGPSQLFPACRPSRSDPNAPCTDFSGTQYQLTSKLTWRILEDHTATLSFYTAPEHREYLNFANATTSAGLFDDSYGATDLVGRYDGKFLDRHLLVEAQGGWHHQSLRNNTKTIDGVDQRSAATVEWGLEHNLADFYSPSQLGPDLFAACDPSASPGFNRCPVTNFLTGGRGYIEDSSINRFSGKLAASGLFSALGHHAVKAGVEVERNSYDRRKTYSGGVTLLEHEIPTYGPTFQDFRNVAVLPDPPPTSTAANAIPFLTSNVEAVSNTRAYFVQDSWAVHDVFTLNFGVRWETQDLFRAGAPGPAPISINDNIGPRVQAIWDFTGRGRGAVKASWGRFYESIPLDLVDRAFGGLSQITSERLHCVPASPGVAGSPVSCDRIANASGGQTYQGFGAGSVPVAPDLKGQYVDMFGASIAYEFLPDFSITLEYQGRRLGRVIEDMSVDDGATYFIANPSESRPFRDPTGALQDPRVATARDPVTGRIYTAAEPRPERSYDGFTIELRKAFSKRWLGQASYTYSTLRGNYPGLFRAETGQLNPNTLSEYDLVSLLPNRYGPLPGDMPHQLKVFGAYLFPLTSRLALLAGAALRAHSGTPVSYLGAHPVYGSGEAFILPRGSAGRTPWVTALDLRGALEYVMAPPYAIRFSVDVFNLLNTQEAVAVDQNYTFDNVQPIVGGQCSARNAASAKNPAAAALNDCPDLRYLRTTDGRPVTVNKNFGKPTQYQAPLAFRFGLALAF
jgi:hypothetical protein